MKSQHTSAWMVSFLCALSVSVFAQEPSPTKNTEQLTSSKQRVRVGAEEQLIRSAYAKLVEYNDAVKVLKTDLGREDVEAGSGLKVELSNFQTGPILQILNKRYLDFVSLPTGDVISLTRGAHSINKSPEEATFEAQWEKGQYASGFDPQWTMQNALNFEPAKYADVGSYTSYTVTVTFNERSRTYKALVLFHNLGQATQTGKPEFWDSILPEMNLVWDEKRPSYKSKPELTGSPTPSALNESVAEPVKVERHGSLVSELASVDDGGGSGGGSSGGSSGGETGGSSGASPVASPDPSKSGDPSASVVKGEFWLSSDQLDHASGSHAGTAVFTPTCSVTDDHRERCEVFVTNFEAYDTGTLNDVFLIWFHRGVKHSNTEVTFGQLGADIKCSSVAGVAFSTCLIGTGCAINIQVSATAGVGGGAIATGGNLWNSAHAVTNNCRLWDGSTAANCTTPGFDGSCPPGSSPNGSGLCCFSSSNSCGNVAAISKCFMYGGEYDLITCSCSGCDVCGGSPIVIDVDGDGIALTGPADGVNFDLNGNGTRDRLGWTRANSDDAWLALDRNENGNIDNGSELFGDFTAQPVGPNKNGFLALAEFDKAANGGNGDGVINSEDTVFDRLRLWQDSNHNGVVDAGELRTLASLNIKELEVDFKESKRTDAFGNEFRYRGKVKDTQEGKVARWAWDVFLSHN
jgi:hypothetical protein